MHPFKSQANDTGSAKAKKLGSVHNTDIPSMKAAGETTFKKIDGSSASMQHKDQSAADGMKRGGHVGKPKHSKPKVKIAMVAPEDTAVPPSPDPSMAAAGAASSPAPAPIPDVPPKAPPFARGGRTSLPKAGKESGLGRLQLSKLQGRKG
jgi:hypothetical protein